MVKTVKQNFESYFFLFLSLYMHFQCVIFLTDDFNTYYVRVIGNTFVYREPILTGCQRTLLLNATQYVPHKSHKCHSICDKKEKTQPNFFGRHFLPFFSWFFLLLEVIYGGSSGKTLNTNRRGNEKIYLQNLCKCIVPGEKTLYAFNRTF